MKSNNGFTLIEVLIAMTVLAVGLLGAASMQASGLKANLTAYHNSQATQLAYDMADRMRVNLADAKDSTGKYATSANTASETQAASAYASCNTISGCSISQMAENDIYEWNAKVNSILPGGVGTIVFADPVYTIIISWNHDRDDTTDALSLPTKFTL